MTRSVSLALAEYATSTSAETIPAEVRERAKQVIFDEMASACFGRRSPAGELAASYATSFGENAESRILGTRLRGSAPLAALANGTAGHGEEMDGAHVVGGHPGATVVHAVTAVAERQRASGADLLNAVVLGYDIGTRLIQACGGMFAVKGRYHLHSDFLHAVSASVAASRVLGLDAIRHCHGMALASFQANGLCALFQESRHISKSLCAGQYAHAGVTATLMASAGFEGCDDVLGTRDGLLEAWGVDGGAASLTSGLGTDYSIMGSNFKFMNAGYPIHAAIEAAMALVASHGIDAESIESVRVGMPVHAMAVVNNREMHNICLQDMLSAALIDGGPPAGESPFPAVLGDPAFSTMRSRISLDVDPVLERQQPNGRGATVAISMVNGQTVSKRVDYPKGHSLTGPIGWPDLSAKWHKALPLTDVDEAIVIARHLEDLPDVGALTAIFSDKQ